MRGVETLAVALVFLAFCSCIACEVDEWGGDPCGRPGGIRYNWVYFLPDT